MTITKEEFEDMLRNDNGCTCDFCTGKKKHEDNWCFRCAEVRMQLPKWWENADVCDECERQMETERKDRITARLAELASLPEEWGGSERPNEHAFSVARSIIDAMEQRGHRMVDIAPMSDGGLDVIYAEDTQSAHFDVYNDGEIVIVTQRRPGDPAQYAELPETEAVAEMAKFLEGVSAS